MAAQFGTAEGTVNNVTSRSHLPQQISMGTTYPWEGQPAAPNTYYDESQVVPTGSPTYLSVESRVHEGSEFIFPSPKHPLIHAWVTEKQYEDQDILSNNGKPSFSFSMLQRERTVRRMSSETFFSIRRNSSLSTTGNTRPGNILVTLALALSWH